MEIHQVRYFLAVCERLSFTQAARQCRVTQPSLTRAIQHLEKKFGGYPFDRRRSNVRLTELGNLVQPYLQEAWEQAQAAKKEARDYSSRAPTQLNLAIMCTIAPGLLIQMFARFRSARPDIKLALINGAAQSIEEQLIGSKAETAIYCRPDRAPDPRLNYLPLFREQMMIVLPANIGWLRTRPSRSPILPANATCSGRSASSTTWWTACSTIGVSIARRSIATTATIGYKP
jgi:DNA-binding transcriptional LysR family regulator